MAAVRHYYVLAAAAAAVCVPSDIVNGVTLLVVLGSVTVLAPVFVIAATLVLVVVDAVVNLVFVLRANEFLRMPKTWGKTGLRGFPFA